MLVLSINAASLPPVVDRTELEVSTASTSAVWHGFSDGCVWLHSDLLFADIDGYHGSYLKEVGYGLSEMDCVHIIITDAFCSDEVNPISFGLS